MATLWLRSRRATAPAIPSSVHGDDEVEAWFRDVVLPSYELWVMGPRRGPAAMMVLNGGWVEQLYVSPDRFRRGLGSKLLRFAQSKRDELSVWTFEANAGARAFYEKHGFVAVRVSADNEEGVPAVCYRWRPSPDGQDSYSLAQATADKRGEAPHVNPQPNSRWGENDGHGRGDLLATGGEKPMARDMPADGWRCEALRSLTPVSSPSHGDQSPQSARLINVAQPRLLMGLAGPSGADQ